jgi:5-methylcytosine-specific restriction protein B
VFVDFVRRAQHDQARDYFFLIDEINRGNLSKIFGELLLLLEADKRDLQYALPLTYRKPDEAPFYLPPNLYVIGTMNTADRSLALVDYALRRRFTFVKLQPRLDGKLLTYLQQAGVPVTLAQELLQRVQALNQQIVKDRNLGEGFQIGHSYFCVPLAGDSPADWWQAIISHDLAPLLEEYWFDDPNGKQVSKAVALLQGEAPAA